MTQERLPKKQSTQRTQTFPIVIVANIALPGYGRLPRLAGFDIPAESR